jgi:hypothetical protein
MEEVIKLPVSGRIPHPFVYDVYARLDDDSQWCYGGRAHGPGEALLFTNYIRARGLQADVHKVTRDTPQPRGGSDAVRP